jgi:hypothetical protein
MDLSLPTREIAHALRTLESAIARLVEVLAHTPVWIEAEADAERSALERVCDAYSAIEYGMEDRADESAGCLAVLGVDATTLDCARAVNASKAAFKTLCTPLTRIQVRIPEKHGDSPTRKITALRYILRTMQRSDLNLLAAYRKIQILLAPPATITYTRACTRSVYRKTLAQVWEMLLTMEGPTADEDRARLSALDPRETHVAFAKEHYPNTRANVVYARLDRRGRGRVQVSAELPLMFAAGRRASAPLVRFPVAEESLVPNHTRPGKLEPTPFLESLPVYRYSDQPRSPFGEGPRTDTPNQLTVFQS